MTYHSSKKEPFCGQRGFWVPQGSTGDQNSPPPALPPDLKEFWLPEVTQSRKKPFKGSPEGAFPAHRAYPRAALSQPSPRASRESLIHRPHPGAGRGGESVDRCGTLDGLDES